MLRELSRRFRRTMRQGREGFSPVEMLMVMMILAVGVVPIAVVQHRARREVTEADRHTDALNVAQSQLERITGMGFGVAVADSGMTGNITWRADVTNVSFGLDRVQVTATWQTSGSTETLTVSDLTSMR